MDKVRRSLILTERRYLKDKQAIWSKLISVYGKHCVYCHRNLATTLDHVIPYSYSGYHGIENLRPCCTWCNLHLSDKLFDDFESKYAFARELYKTKSKNDMLICSTCLLPFYSAMQSNAFLCNYCYSKEYINTTCNDRTWSNWLSLLEKSKIDYEAHFKLSDYLETLNTSIPKKDKIELLQKFTSKDWGEFFEYIF